MDPLTAAVGLGSIAGGIFGAKKDSDNLKRQLEMAKQQREESLRFIREQMGQGRNDLFSFFPQAQQSRQMGFDAARGVMSQAYPQMFESFTGGNVGAQQALLAGLPQMQNALMGNKIDYSAMQPTRLPVNLQALSGIFNPPSMSFAPMSQVPMQQPMQQPQIDPSILAMMGMR